MREVFSFFTIQSPSDHFDYVIATILVSSIFWYIWLYAKSKQRFPPLPPGPRGLPIVGNLPFLHPELHTYFHKLAQKHGPVLKLWLGAKLTIVISSSEATREVLRTNDVIFANHDVPVVGPISTYGGIDIVWSPYGPEWRMLRKICINRLLSNATLDSNAFNSLRCRETRKTVRYLADRARTGSPVNLGEQIFVTILNVVTQMLWGATVADGEERESVGAEFLEIVREIIDIAGKPNVSDFFPVLSRFDLQGLVKRTRGPAQRLDRMFDRIINQRVRMDKGNERNGEDFLQVLLKVKDEDDKTPLSMNHVKALLLDMVLGGTDTCLNTIEFAMAELINKPEIMKRAQQELDKIVGKNNIVEETHITKLPYILCIMKETLRLHPTLPLLIPRCPSETTVIGGYTIPKDSKVFINVWAIHRNPNVWENPLEFNPDRFLYKVYDFSGNDYNYFPFGSGRRICTGMAMADRIVLYNLATFLHSFDWNIGEGEQVKLEEKFGIVLKLKHPLVATPVLRLSDPNLYL
ncbi:hypothetical protein CARUB_v10003550mg [Capsella rubella]|uniref:Cytochrome P450 n=1 Tax=Capsella rubella TaxID=81985 RepID=R0FC92_9BRAS|nr:cytochrome P450 93A3 [Capsella rubella]EOA19702.1 hypothetical protein CARUB_v10003550mg [Capsella rubella]